MKLSADSNLPEKILFVSHKAKNCGVHEYGISIANALKRSGEYSFLYAECSTPQEFSAEVEAIRPVAIIYNYYASTLPWLNKKLLDTVDLPHLGIMHEATQQAADSADTSFFDYHIAPDPTLVINNPIVFKTGRVIPPYTNRFDLPAVTTIGTFGFATAGKGFERLIIAVEEEFDEAIIRLHVPRGDFVSSDGKDVAQRCQELIVKNGIKLIVTHEFLEKNQLLDFLAQNTLNAFFYEKGDGRGISSAVETALAVRRPIAITRSKMFRHVLTGLPEPPICIETNEEAEMSWTEQLSLRWRRHRYLRRSKTQLPVKWLAKPKISLREIIENGIQPLLPFYSQWNEPNLVRDYERILGHVLGTQTRKTAWVPGH
jgi:hypothetical protein